MNDIISNCVRANCCLIPAIYECVLYTLSIGVSGTRIVGIIAPITVLAQSDATTLGVVNDVVLDNPTPAPVGANDRGLLGRRRCPIGCGIPESKTADMNVVNEVFFRVKYGLTHVYFHVFGRGVSIGKLCINFRGS